MSARRPIARPIVRPIIRFVLAVAFAGFASFGLAAPAQALKPVKVTSPGGITAWLVEDHTNPIVTLNFAVGAGTSIDPAGKEGVVQMMVAMLDEGAGDLPSEAFQVRLKQLSARLSFDASADRITGGLTALSANRDASFDLLALALRAPRFDTAPLERTREQMLSELRRAQTEPWSIAQRLWWSAAFPAHPYGRRAAGTPDSVKSLTAADLQAQHRIAFSRDTLVVGVVGDITADQLKILLDRVFGALPATADRPKVATVAPVATGQIAVARRESSQSVVIFGHAGIARDDKDFYPAFVMNHLLGGGSFSSRLYMEIREKRGLAYSVSTSVSTLDHSNLLYGSVATKNERVKESIDLIRAEWRRMAEHGVTQSELDGAKAFLVRSYALRFSSSSAIASILVGVQLDKMDIDFFEKRNGYVEAVTVEDIKRVAARLLKADKLTFTVVGNPQGVDG